MTERNSGMTLCPQSGTTEKMTSAQEAIAREVRRAVGLIGPSVMDVAKELHVSRQAIYRWMGGEISYERLDQLAARVGTLTIRIGDDEEAAWPEWARRLDAKLDQLLSDHDVRRPRDQFDVNEEHRPAEAER